MGKFSTPRVPIQTPMFDAQGLLTRTWVIFFERLGQHYSRQFGGHVIGWDIQDATVGLDVSDPVIPVVSGPIARCFIRIKVTDSGAPLEIDIRNNGVSIFDTKPLLPAGSNGRVVHEFPTKADLSVLEHDDVVIDIVQGGAWEFAAYVPYEATAE